MIKYSYRKHLHLNRIGEKNTYFSYKKYNKIKTKFRDPALRKALWKTKHRCRDLKQLDKEQKNEKKDIFKYAQENFKKELKFEMKVFFLIKAFFDFKIVRQYIIDSKYIADLYIPDKKFIIEVDGEYHNTEEQRIKDKEREEYLINKGFKLIRFKNEEVKNNLLGILEILKDNL
jgi:very-short-patch-repair endonuclease